MFINILSQKCTTVTIACCCWCWSWSPKTALVLFLPYNVLSLPPFPYGHDGWMDGRKQGMREGRSLHTTHTWEVRSFVPLCWGLRVNVNNSDFFYMGDLTFSLYIHLLNYLYHYWKIYFIYSKGRIRGGGGRTEREWYSICWFTPQMTAMPGVTRSFFWVSQGYGPSSTTFSGTSTGSWNGAPGTQTGWHTYGMLAL